MPLGILGKKLGMTRVLQQDGKAIPVTVIEVGPCTVLQVLSVEKNGYDAIQLGFDERMTGEQWARVRKTVDDTRQGDRLGGVKLRGNLKGLTLPELGHLIKTAKDSSPKHFVKEVPVAEGEAFEPGQAVTVDACAEWHKVDVIGKSIGRGTCGTMRAHNFSSGPGSHGSKHNRLPGSIGMAAYPKRVLKGKRMYTRWGNERATVRNLDVIKVDSDRSLLLVKGGIPGPQGGYVVVRKAVAAREKKAE